MNAKDAVAALGGLAQDTRLQVFQALVKVGSDGLAAGVIGEQVGVLPSSLTFHLRQLLRAGLVTQRRMSRQLIYAADHDAINGLVAFLMENCCKQKPECVPACASDVAPPRPVRRKSIIS